MIDHLKIILTHLHRLIRQIRERYQLHNNLERSVYSSALFYDQSSSLFTVGGKTYNAIQ